MEKAWELLARKNLKERQVGKGHRRPGRNKVINWYILGQETGRIRQD